MQRSEHVNGYAGSDAGKHGVCSECVYHKTSRHVSMVCLRKMYYSCMFGMFIHWWAIFNDCFMAPCFMARFQYRTRVFGKSDVFPIAVDRYLFNWIIMIISWSYRNMIKFLRFLDCNIMQHHATIASKPWFLFFVIPCHPCFPWPGEAEVTQIRAGMVVMQALFEQRKRKFITQMEEDKAPRWNQAPRKKKKKTYGEHGE